MPKPRDLKMYRVNRSKAQFILSLYAKWSIPLSELFPEKEILLPFKGQLSAQESLRTW